VHFELAGVYDEANEPEQAILHYQQALKKDEANGNRISAASSLANLGALYRDASRWKESAESFQRSLALDKETGNMEGQLNTLDALKGLYLHRKAWERANNTAQQGLALAVGENIGYWKANFYMKLAQGYELQENWRQALQNFHLAKDSGEQELSKQSLDWLSQKIAEMASAIVH
jgi:tetratricopeptide (TPR) repeat protein